MVPNNTLTLHVGNTSAAAAAAAASSSQTQALDSQSSVESPSSVTGEWNRYVSSKTILHKLKEEKLQGQESNDDPSSRKIDLEAAAESAAAGAEEAADSTSITKYTHRTPFPVSPSNSYSLLAMITVKTSTPNEVKNKSPIFLKWEQMAAKNNNNNNASSIVETADSPKGESSPSTPATEADDDNNNKSIVETAPSPDPNADKIWSPPKPRAIAVEEMRTTLKEVANKISPPAEFSPISRISKRWPPSKQPHAPADEGRRVTTSSTESIEKKSSSVEVGNSPVKSSPEDNENIIKEESNVESTTSTSFAHSGKLLSPSELFPEHTPALTTNHDVNSEESNVKKSSSPSGISKRWPSASPANEEEKPLNTALTVANNKISPTLEIVEEHSAPAVPTIKPNATNKIVNEKASLSPGISKRWPPSKTPASEEERKETKPQITTSTETNNKVSPPLEIVDENPTPVLPPAKPDATNKEVNVKSSSPSGIGKRWPPSISSAYKEEETQNTSSTETTNKNSPTLEIVDEKLTLPLSTYENPTPDVPSAKPQAINKVVNVSSSSSPGISKRWPPSKIPAYKEKKQVEEKEEEPHDTTSGTTDKIPPTLEIADEQPTPDVPNVKPNATNKEGNVKSSSSPGISKRWPPSKPPANEEKQVIPVDATKEDSKILATKTFKEKQTTAWSKVNDNEGTNESHSKSPGPPANASLENRWPKANKENNTTSTSFDSTISTTTTSAVSGSNKLKGRWPPAPQVDNDEEMALHAENVGAVSYGVLSEFRTLVENLVCKMMPTEVDHVDELIEEYEGREAELLDILSSMQENEDFKVGVAVSDESGNGLSICSNTTEPVSNKSTEKLIEASTEGHPFDEESAHTGGEEGAEEDSNGPGPDKQARPKRTRRTLIVVAVTSCLFLAGVALALGFTFGDDWFSESTQSSAFIARDDSDIGIATGDFSSATQVPTPSPIEGNNSLGTSLTACDSEEYIQELGLTSLAASYPKVAIDGDQAIVASGSGYVAFFALDPETKTWTRTALFGLMVNVGEINSVAIHGNTAVIGAPKATTDLSAYRDEPLDTGAIFIYEKLDPSSSSSWEQKKGPYVPNEYKKGVVMDNYGDANFGTSVDIYDDLIVASAPPESNNRGSVTVFKRDTESNDWVQLERLYPPDTLTCGSKFFGYSVRINQYIIAASADCDVNVVLFEVDRSDGNDTKFMKFQELEFVNAGYGAISSITIGENHLAYSTVKGGLCTYKRDSQKENFVLGQELSFDFDSGSDALYEYPLSSDESMLALSVANEVLLYTRNLTSKEWMQESLILPIEGDFKGYTAATSALSNGTVMVADQFEVRMHDFMGCRIEFTAPEPSSESTLAIEIGSTVSENPTTSPTSAGCFPLNVIVTLDENPSDIRWEIIPHGDIKADLIASSPVYDDSMAFTQADKQVVCLPGGTYDFTIYDDYGGESNSDWFNVTFRLLFDDEEVGRGESFGRNKTITFSTPSPDECSVVIVNLRFDKYPQDESWRITQDGVVVASSSPFAEGATEDVQELCLPEGDYVFTIYDVYGDGLCCEWGEGGYTVRTEGQVVIAEGAEFGPSESREFTLPISFTYDSQ